MEFLERVCGDIKSNSKGALLMQFLSIFIVTTLVAITGQAYSIAPSICDKPEGYDVDNTLLNITDLDCGKEEQLCGVIVTAPAYKNGRKFNNFVLRTLDDEKIMVSLNLAVIKTDNAVEASLYLDKDILNKSEIHAVYDVENSCSLHAIVYLTKELGSDSN